MPRLLQALESVLRKDNAIVEPPPTLLQRLLDGDALALLRELASSLQLRMPRQIKSLAAGFAEGKSQSELIFLASMALAVVLFVVILPAYEALFGDEAEASAKTLSEPPPSPSRMRMYRPGHGVVEVDVQDLPSEGADGQPMLRLSSGESSTRSSSRSCGSSCSMETIEESSEEEELEEMEMEDDRSEILEGKELDISAISSEEEEDETEEEAADQEEVDSRRESVRDKTCYYDFLTFINTPSGRQLVVPTTEESDAEDEEEDDATLVTTNAAANKPQEVENPFADLLALRQGASQESNAI